MELRIFGRIHLLHGKEGVEHAKYEYGGSDIETPLDRIRNHTRIGGVPDTQPGEEDREEIAHQASGVAEEALYGICSTFLFLVDHIAHHHLERLHRHIDGGIEEHQRKNAEPHRSIETEQQPACREIETSRVRQQGHYYHGYHRAYEQIRLAAAHPAPPGPVGPLAYERLNEHTHKRRKYPEIAETVGIRAKRGENPAYVCTLQRICNLDAEKPETQVHKLSERKTSFCGHILVISSLRGIRKYKEYIPLLYTREDRRHEKTDERQDSGDEQKVGIPPAID